MTGDPRYAAGKNGKPPRKVGSTLVLLDCLSCDKCVPVCPNDANFAIDTPPEELAYEDVVVDAAGAIARVAGGRVDGEEAAAVGQLRRRVQRVRQLRRLLSRGRRPLRDEGALLRLARQLRGVSRPRRLVVGARRRGAARACARRRASGCALELRGRRATIVEDDIVQVHHDAVSGDAPRRRADRRRARSAPDYRARSS